MGVYSRLVESRNAKAESDSAPVSDPPAAEPPPAARGFDDILAGVSERVQELLDSAERTAIEIRSEAEAASKRHLEERREEADRVFGERLRELQRVARSLSTRTSGIWREISSLTLELEEATSRLERLGGPDPLAATPEGEPEEPPTEPDRLESEPIAYPGTAAGAPDRALLRATQMAVAGTDRAEIERMLRTDFGLDDPASVVDEILSDQRS